MSFAPGNLVEVSYLDEDDRTMIIAYRGVIQGPAKRAGDYVVRVSEVFDPDMTCTPGDLRAPILGDGKVALRKID